MGVGGASVGSGTASGLGTGISIETSVGIDPGSLIGSATEGSAGTTIGDIDAGLGAESSVGKCKSGIGVMVACGYGIGTSTAISPSSCGGGSKKGGLTGGGGKIEPSRF